MAMDRSTGGPYQSTCAPWALPADVKLADPTSLDPDNLLDCLQAASDVLYALSGSRFSGGCQDTVRPCARMVNRDHGRPIGQSWPGAAWGGFGYWPGGWGSAGFSRWGWCTCNQEEQPGGNALPSVDLGVWPLTGIVVIYQDGAVVEPTTYEIQDNRHLVRLADPTTTPPYAKNPGWPCCQRLDLPGGLGGQPGTWQVTFTYGIAPPPSGKLACAELGYQLYLATTPARVGECRLPSRVTHITRQGVSAVVLDPMSFIDQGKTGLYQCDSFLEAVNPGNLRRRATVSTPDIGRRVRRTQGNS